MINGKRGKFSIISLGSRRLAQAVFDENETSLDFTPKVRLKEYKIGRVRIKIRIHLVPLPLLIAQCSLNSTNFLSKYRSYK